MKRICILFLILFLIHGVRGQALDQSIKLNVGVAKHGSGDEFGFIQSVEYEKFFQKKLSWAIEIGSSIHSGQYPEFYTDNNGVKHDISFRYTTAGVQTAGMIGYSLIRKTHSILEAKIGPVFRFQSSSTPNSLTTLYPGGTQLPFPVMVVENTTRQNTYAVGGLLRVAYRYIFNNRLFLGLNTGFQIDSNGDVLAPQLNLSVGKFLNK